MWLDGYLAEHLTSEVRGEALEDSCGFHWEGHDWLKVVSWDLVQCMVHNKHRIRPVRVDLSVGRRSTSHEPWLRPRVGLWGSLME
jgi:hypothetical protein